jgi:hypothetical protein
MEKHETISLAIKKRFGQHIAFLQQLARARSTNSSTPETSDPVNPVEKAVADVIHSEMHQLCFKAEMIGVTT